MGERERLTERVLRSQWSLFGSMRMSQMHNWLSVELTMPQLKALLLIVESEGATGRQIAGGLSVGLPTISGIVDRLHEQGLVTRGEDPNDRRATRVVATSAGREQIDRLYRVRARWLTSLLDRLDLDRLKVVEEAFGYMVEVAAAQVAAEQEAASKD